MKLKTSKKPATKPVLKPTRNPLPSDVRRKSVDRLNDTVADLTDLHARIKQAHWNLRGEAFSGLHPLLDEFAAGILRHVDVVAERASALGGLVEGTLRDSARQSRLGAKEEPASKSGQRDWLNELADTYATCGEHVLASIRKADDQEDFVTADLLTALLHDTDKHLWLLESHLNR